MCAVPSQLVPQLLDPAGEPFCSDGLAFALIPPERRENARNGKQNCIHRSCE